VWSWSGTFHSVRRIDCCGCMRCLTWTRASPSSIASIPPILLNVVRNDLARQAPARFPKKDTLFCDLLARRERPRPVEQTLQRAFRRTPLGRQLKQLFRGTSTAKQSAMCWITTTCCLLVLSHGGRGSLFAAVRNVLVDDTRTLTRRRPRSSACPKVIAQ